MATPFIRLEAALGYSFQRPALLQQVLTHRSFSADNYERLEFIGDGIVNMVVAFALYEKFPHIKEGELSRLRAQLVRQDALHALAEKLGLSTFLRLGEGELKSGGQHRPSILADTVEAVMGAIYLDGGFEPAKRVIDGLYAERLAQLDPTRSLKDPKTALQEHQQSKRQPLPVYDSLAVRGEGHAQIFEVACRIDEGRVVTHGTGPSRRAAEQAAAQAALEQLGLV